MSFNLVRQSDYPATKREWAVPVKGWRCISPHHFSRRKTSSTPTILIRLTERHAIGGKKMWIGQRWNNMLPETETVTRMRSGELWLSLHLSSKWYLHTSFDGECRGTLGGQWVIGLSVSLATFYLLQTQVDKLHTPTRLFPKRVPVSGLTRADLTSDEGKTKKTGGRGGQGIPAPSPHTGCAE